MPGTDINLKAYIQAYDYIAPYGLQLDTPPDNLETNFDIKPLLKDPKTFKLMSKQDMLATYCGIKAVSKSTLTTQDLNQRTGLYLSVGILPFEDKHLDRLYRNSQKDNTFDMGLFSTDCFHSMNPLLTFKCLPNMPLFHISSNLSIHGKYFITYPSSGQWFMALYQALIDLHLGVVDYAVLVATADQRNFLVAHHLARISDDSRKEAVDCACTLVLSKSKTEDSIAALQLSTLSYRATNPFAGKIVANEAQLPVETGAVEPSLYLALNLDKSDKLECEYRISDNYSGFEAKQTMQIL